MKGARTESPPPGPPAYTPTHGNKRGGGSPKSDSAIQDHTNRATHNAPWSGAQGPTLTPHQQEAVLNDVTTLHALHTQANKTSRLVKWASIVAGVGVGLAAGIGLAVATGPAGLFWALRHTWACINFFPTRPARRFRQMRSPFWATTARFCEPRRQIRR